MNNKTISEDKRLNVITFTSFHVFELKKHLDWIFKYEQRGLKPKMKMLMQNAKVNIDRLNDEFLTVLDYEEHEQMSILIDDLGRLLIKYPHLKNEIMDEVEKAVIKYENIK